MEGFAMFGRSLAAILIFSSAGLAQGQVELVQPIACELGQTCVIQQFMDHDASDGVADFACGAAAYDGHKGTDFRVRPGDLKRGVQILAAQDGIVLGLRDGMVDRRIQTDEDRRAVDGKECGNGVVLRHGDGWETQYCHMKQGSVAVKKGQRVVAGDVLGLVGLSGKTQFPHLHLSVRKDGVPVDPFTRNFDGNICGYDASDTLWSREFAQSYVHQPTVIAQFGFADAALKIGDVVDGVWDGFVPRTGTPLVVYGLAVNGQTGDQITLTLRGPEGIVVKNNAKGLERRKAQWMSFAGKKPPAGGWPAGEYVAQISVLRDGAVLDQQSVAFVLE